MNTTAKRGLKVTDLSKMKQLNIEPGEDTSVYAQHVIDEVVRLMSESPEESGKLIGVAYGVFPSRKDEARAIAGLREKGFTAKLVIYPGKTDPLRYCGLLVERAPIDLPPAYDIPGP